METRRGRREIEVTRMRWGGIKRGESKLANNHFLMCAPQSGSLRDIHGVIQRREEGGRRQRWPRRKKGGIKSVLLPTHNSTGDPLTLAGSFDSVFCGITSPFHSVLMHTRLFFFSKIGVFVSLSPCGSPIIKSWWSSRSDSLGLPSPFVGSPSWEDWRGVQNLNNSGITSLILLFSCLWIIHPVVMGFVLSWSCLSYHLTVVSSLSLEVEYLFGGFQFSPFNGCSTTSCNFGTIIRGDECYSFYVAILNHKSVHLHLKILLIYITSRQIDGGENWNSNIFYFSGLPNHCGWGLQPWNERTLSPWKKSKNKSIHSI